MAEIQKMGQSPNGFWLNKKQRPEWPFRDDDLVTENDCHTLRPTHSRYTLGRTLVIARNAGSGPPFITKFRANGTLECRYYKWKDIKSWIGFSTNDEIHPYIGPPSRYNEDHEIISLLQNALDIEKQRGDNLQKELSIAERPQSPPGLLDRDTILAIKQPYNNQSGVYFLINDDEIVYIGKSTNMFRRIHDHSRSGPDKMPITFSHVSFLPAAIEDIDNLELVYIRHFTPKHNGINSKLSE